MATTNYFSNQLGIYVNANSISCGGFQNSVATLAVVQLDIGQYIWPGAVITVSTCGTSPSATDTLLYMGTSCPYTSFSDFQCLAGDDNSGSATCGAGESKISNFTVPLSRDQRYYYLLVGVGGGTTLGSLKVRCAAKAARVETCGGGLFGR